MVVYFQTLTSPIRIEKLGKECEQGYILKIFDIKSTKSYNSQSSDDTFSTDCWMRSPSPERQNEIARLEMNKCRSKRFLGSFMRLGSIFCHFGQQHSSKKTKTKTINKKKESKTNKQKCSFKTKYWQLVLIHLRLYYFT